MLIRVGQDVLILGVILIWSVQFWSRWGGGGGRGEKKLRFLEPALVFDTRADLFDWLQTALTNEEVFSELYYSKKAILEVTGTHSPPLNFSSPTD